MRPRNEIKVLVVEDEKYDEAATREMLASAGYQQVVCLSSTEATQAWLGQNKPDIVLMDLRLPKRDGGDASQANGLDLIDDIKVARIPIIVLSMWATINWVVPVLARNIGYLRKNDIKDPAFLDSAIQATLGGGVIYSGVPMAMIQSLATKTSKRADLNELSHREKQVVYLYAFKFQGGEKSDEKVAQVLVIQPDTASKHRKNSMEKLDLHTSTELVLWAHQNAGEFEEVKDLFRDVTEA